MLFRYLIVDMSTGEKNINKLLTEAISRLPRVDVMPVASMLYQEYTALDTRFGVTPANILFGLHRAREAQELAVSWRRFNVGAAVISFVYQPACIALFSGINIKPEEETIVNIHAEQLALQKVADNKVDRIAAVIVVGNIQADTQSGQLAKTLHPCGLCRTALTKSEAVDSEHTLIVSAIPSLKTIEMYSLAALERFHTSGKLDEIVRIEIEEDLDLLKPFNPHDTTKPYILIDDNRSQYEEDVWNNALGAPLTNFRLKGSLV